MKTLLKLTAFTALAIWGLLTLIDNATANTVQAKEMHKQALEQTIKGSK